MSIFTIILQICEREKPFTYCLWFLQHVKVFIVEICSILLSVAVINQDKSDLGRKGNISSYTSRSQSITEGRKGGGTSRNQGGCFLLACSWLLPHQVSYTTRTLCLGVALPTVVWALPNQLATRQFPTDLSDLGNPTQTPLSRYLVLPRLQ